jgi:uncharacterized repeat protein (TIGR02543 family)
MRNKFLTLLIPVFVITALILTACSSGETDKVTKKQCTVTFDTVIGKASTPAPDTIIVKRGGTMDDQYPEDPVTTISDMLFYGWWDSGIEYAADTLINSDLDLKARWEAFKDTVKVSFDSAGGSAAPDMQVLEGKSIGPRIPVSRKKGYIFDGWFVDDVPYTAAEPVINAEITLTAHWTEKTKHTVSFRTNDSNLLSGGDVDQCTVESIQVYEGEGLEDDLPTATHTNNKIKFIRWTGADNEIYDEWTPINEDMTFYAKWGLEPFKVDLSKTQLFPGQISAQTPDLKPEYIAGTKSIKNTVKYDGAENRWLIMYRIGLVNKADESKSVLPADFNMGYYTRYNVRAKFYGNERAIKGNPLYSVGYMDDANAIKTVGQEMPPKAGYGQISWCTTVDSNGNPGQAKASVIAQQYNLGTTTINNQWLVGGTYEGSKADAIRPAFLLVQTSDNWIGWIEITEIAFHNGEPEFVPPPASTE